MCVYLYSPGCNLTLDYFIESIVLHLTGSSEIIIDALITNKSSNEIDKIYLLLPYRLLNVEQDETNKPLGLFEDITLTYTNKNLQYNKLYRGGINSVQKNSDEWRIDIETPNPMSPFNRVPYKGVIRGKSSLKLIDNFCTYKNKILHDINFSILQCNFSIPIFQEEARWVRWKICPKYLAIDYPTNEQYLLKWLLNEINIGYELISPFDIKENFLNKIECYITECDQNNPTNVILANEAKEIKKMIYDDGFNQKYTFTQFPDYRINIFPSDFQEMKNIILTGDIKKSITPYLNLDEHILQLKTGERNIKLNNNGYFSISFIARHVSGLITWLPALSFILAIISIVLSIVLFKLGRLNK